MLPVVCKWLDLDSLMWASHTSSQKQLIWRPTKNIYYLKNESTWDGRDEYNIYLGVIDLLQKVVTIFSPRSIVCWDHASWFTWGFSSGMWGRSRLVAKFASGLWAFMEVESHLMPLLVESLWLQQQNINLKQEAGSNIANKVSAPSLGTFWILSWICRELWSHNMKQSSNFTWRTKNLSLLDWESRWISSSFLKWTWSTMIYNGLLFGYVYILDLNVYLYFRAHYMSQWMVDAHILVS